MLLHKFETNLCFTGPTHSMKQEVPPGMGSIPRDKILAQFPKIIFAPGEHQARERHRLVRDIEDTCIYINRASDTDPSVKWNDFITEPIGISSDCLTNVELYGMYGWINTNQSLWNIYTPTCLQRRSQSFPEPAEASIRTNSKFCGV
jgi:hypothetical protein